MYRVFAIFIVSLWLTACSDRTATRDNNNGAQGPSSDGTAQMVEQPILTIEEPTAKMEDYMDNRLSEAVAIYESGQRQRALPVFADYARRDNPVALNYMGHYASVDMAGIQDERLAQDYYHRAAIIGYAPAQHNLGMLLSKEGNSEQDLITAAEWFSRAAAQGYGPSLYNLGVRYVLGVGVPINYEEALNDFQRAAQLGIDEARYNLAIVYNMTETGHYDPKLCYVWANLALEKYPQAEPLVRDCGAQLAGHQRDEAATEINLLRNSLPN